MGVGIEVVCARVEEAVAAEEAGADRIELVSSISAGGLTPSAGCTRLCLEGVTIPVVPILRPREGGFCYSESEFATMQRDLESFAAAGVHEVSVGILDSKGQLDFRRMSQLHGVAPKLAIMCHRAFDLAPDPVAALEGLIELGVKRVLTSGGKRFAMDAVKTLRRLVDAAKGRIEIVAAGGIRATNVLEIVEKGGVSSVHLGPTLTAYDPTSRLGTEVDYGEHLELNAKEVASVADALSKI